MTDRHPPFDVGIPFKGEREPEEIRVVNLRKTLPIPKIDSAEKQLVADGMAAEFAQLGEDEWHTIANAVTDLDALRADLREGRYREAYGESAVLITIGAEVMLAALFPLMQPRIAGEPAATNPPKVTGRMLEGAKPIAGLVIQFDDEQHLREHLEEQIKGTLDAGSDLRASILSHGVTEPLLAYPAVLVVGDTELDVMALGDGITRAIRCWHNIYGADVTKPQLAEKIVEGLLARGTSRRRHTTESGARREGRRETYLDLRARVVAHGDRFDAPEVVRISQSITVPVNIAIGFRSLLPATGVGTEYLFQDAIGSAVAQIHTLGRPWTPAVIGANVMTQAIHRAAAEGVLSQATADVAQGSRTPVEIGVAVMTAAPDIGLARGVWLSAILLDETNQQAIKRNIRSLRGLKQVRKENYASMMLSVIDQPWRAGKRNSRNNAASVWKVGGPIPHTLHEVGFNPIFVANYLDLVGPALDDKHPKHHSALATLRVAGGIALTADGLLLSPTGSSTEVAPDRTAPHLRVNQLARSEIGLCALAHAANSFRSDREASNSYTLAQRRKLNDLEDAASRLYIVAKPSDDDPYQPIYDPDYGFADIVKYCKLGEVSRTAAGSSAAGSPQPVPRTAKQVADDLRAQLQEQLTAVRKTARDLRGHFAKNRHLLAGEDADFWRDELEEPATKTAFFITSIVNDLEAEEDDDVFEDDDSADDLDADDNGDEL